MRYTVYLEVQEDGMTMAHVPQLPGCVSSGNTQEVALARTPDAIHAYYTWMQQHGEAVPQAIEPIEIEVGGVINDPDNHLGDEAGLLPSDRAPLSEAEVGQLMRLMAYSRRDPVGTGDWANARSAELAAQRGGRRRDRLVH